MMASSLRAGDREGAKVQREMLRAKVHRIRVTDRNVEYEGSITLDRDLMDASDMVEFERVDVYNVDNGKRFSTYVIEGERGSGDCCPNGAAAHLVDVGDRLIIASYCAVDEAEIREHTPTVVIIGDGNTIQEIKEFERSGTLVG
jgi:aspartate 1-decarboxylase